MRGLVTILVACFSAFSYAGELDWTVRNKWSASYEKKFSEFVKVMGESGCRSFTECVRSARSNPFYSSKTPRSKSFPADCADLPFTMRLYFSWMEGLPFDYVSVPTQANPNQESSGDIRYTKYGNKPAKKRSMTPGNTYDAAKEMANLRDSVSTATYRMHYQYKSDFYPPKLDLNNIQPGTVVYDPAGHAAIVYKIEKDGRVRMMDAHPDNSITRITYDQKFVRSRPAHGAGFRNWRPELDDRPTEELPGFSTEQFNKSFTVGGESVSYYDFVRAQMSGGSLKFRPVEEMKSMVAELCSNVQDRAHAVEAGIRSGIQQKGHPTKLPSNIYGTSGEWEEYSTPSRDARLKVAFVEIRKEIERFIGLYQQGSSRVEYTPVASRYSQNCSQNRTCFLIASLMEAYAAAIYEPGCDIQYTNSRGGAVKLSYSDVVSRLFKLSFDPYHCVELRWGAQSTEELASCPDDRYKRQWYEAEQGLRNQIERTYDLRMDYDVNGTAQKLGVAQAPDVDLWTYLNRALKNSN
ncbi:MAG: hypothetical protein AB7F86_03560 [Bdellovibrionales bacterium]